MGLASGHLWLCKARVGKGSNRSVNESIPCRRRPWRRGGPGLGARRGLLGGVSWDGEGAGGHVSYTIRVGEPTARPVRAARADATRSRISETQRRDDNGLRLHENKSTGAWRGSCKRKVTQGKSTGRSGLYYIIRANSKHPLVADYIISAEPSPSTSRAAD